MRVSLASLQDDYPVGIFGILAEYSERRQKRHPERDGFYTPVNWSLSRIIRFNLQSHSQSIQIGYKIHT